MTPAEIAQINRAALALDGASLQRLLDEIRVEAAGRAGPLPLSIAPGYSSDRRIKRPVINWYSGTWFDGEGGYDGGRGDDLVSMIAWMAGIDDEADAREQAARALQQFFDSLPAPQPSPMRPNVERYEVGRLAPKVRPVRNLRRGG